MQESVVMPLVFSNSEPEAAMDDAHRERSGFRMKAALRLVLVAVALGSPPRAVADTTDTILGQGFGQPPSPSYPREPYTGLAIALGLSQQVL
jgi:hypothetical protein